MSDLLVFKAVLYAKLLAAVPGIEHWKAQARRGNRLIKKVFFFFQNPPHDCQAFMDLFPVEGEGRLLRVFENVLGLIRGPMPGEYYLV